MRTCHYTNWSLYEHALYEVVLYELALYEFALYELALYEFEVHRVAWPHNGVDTGTDKRFGRPLSKP